MKHITERIWVIVFGIAIIFVGVISPKTCKESLIKALKD